MNEEIARMVMEKPPAWRYRLLARLLRDGLVPIRRECDALADLEGAWLPGNMDVEGTMRFGMERMLELDTWIGKASRAVDVDLAKALGSREGSANPEGIHRAVDEILFFCRRICDWERMVRTASPEPHWLGVFRRLYRVAPHYTKQFEMLVDGLCAAIISPPQNGAHQLIVNLSPPWDSVLLELEVQQAVERSAGARVARQAPLHLLAGVGLGTLLCHLLIPSDR